MSPAIKTTTISIHGMHCAACDILVKTRLENRGNIIEVVPHFQTHQATITHHGELSLVEINAVLCEYGYTVSSLDEVISPPDRHSWTQSLGIAAILAILYYFAKVADILPDSLTSPATSLGGAFVLGLIASASTCMATTGALFTSFLHKQRGNLWYLGGGFMIGRMLSYALFGYVFGLFGQVFVELIQLGSILNLVVAFVLIAVGLDMLRLVSLQKLISRLPGGRAIITFQRRPVPARHSLAYAVALGALTYFLPCGFTLSTQAYALSLGDAVRSSELMTAFALGTIPSLGIIALISKIRVHAVYSYFLKVVAILIIFVGLGYVANTATLYGVRIHSFDQDTSIGEIAPIVDGKQIVKMTALSTGYTPNRFIVRAHIPVRWEVTGQEIYGCQGTIQAPLAGVPLTNLKEGPNTFEFTTTTTGSISFSCSMGMFRGEFKVI